MQKEKTLKHTKPPTHSMKRPSMKGKGIRFGPAGIPLSTPKPADTITGIHYTKSLGLNALELEFVRSVFLKEDKAEEVGGVAQKEDITLTAHAPYYVNLATTDEKKREATKNRILSSMRALHAAKGYSVVFHPGFYQKDTPERVHTRILSTLKEIRKTADDEGLTVWLRPETMGKPSQYGSLSEVLTLSQNLEGVMPCIDFAHLHARSNGKYNTADEFAEILTRVEDALGSEALREMHVHFSGIAYGEKGEKHHLTLKESDFNYEDWLSVLKAYRVEGVFISESPNIEEDALLAKKTYETILPWKKKA